MESNYTSNNDEIEILVKFTIRCNLINCIYDVISVEFIFNKARSISISYPVDTSYT